MRNKLKRCTSLVLALCLVLSVFAGSVYADTRTFEDIKGHWAEKSIQKLANQGIVTGFTDSLCHPDETITRAEFVSIISRMMNQDAKLMQEQKMFTDIGNHWAKQNILYLIEKNVIREGDYQGHLFEPNKSITRLEMVKMLVRSLCEEKHNKDCLCNIGFTDIKQLDKESKIYLCLAKAYQIIKGYPDSTVRPNGNATRAEAFEMLIKSEEAKKSIKEEKPLEKPSRPSGGGSMAYEPVPKFDLELPETAHTDKSIDVVLKIEQGKPNNVTWLVEKDNKIFKLKEVANGNLESTGGIIQFKEAGTYKLKAEVVSSNSKKAVVSKTINIYPVAEVKLNMNRTTHTDEAVTLNTECKNNENVSVDWELKKDGKNVDIKIQIEGELDLSQSAIYFKDKGSYQLTVTLIDKTGRTFTDTAYIAVYPVGTVGFYLPKILHTDETVKVEATLSEIGDKVATWTVQKDGKEIPFSDCIDGRLKNNGGDIRFKEKGEYSLKCSFTDDGGRTYSFEQDIKVYPVPTVTYSQPKFVYTDTDVKIETSTADLEGLSLEWLVDNSFGYQDFNTFVEGKLNNGGGNISFKRAGIYELVCRFTDETGRVFLFEPRNKTEVLPVLTLNFELPKVAYTDTEIDIRTSGHNNTLPVEWNLHKDEKTVSFEKYIDGDLNNLGGKINFKMKGNYLLTAKITDLLDRSFSCSKRIDIMPIAEFSFSTVKEVNYGEKFDVTIDNAANIENAKVAWKLIKNGVQVTYEGELTKEGGRISIHDIGDFEMIAVVTDELGRECSCVQKINVINTAPTVEEINIVTTRTVKDEKFLVNVSAVAKDAEQHETILEWQGRSEDSYYTVGTHTIKVRVKDVAGAYSDWIEKTFKISSSAPTRPVIERTPNGNSVVPGTPVTITANSTDEDGDEITYVWEGRELQTQSYPLGKNVVRVKAIDSTGAESPWAAIVFFVMDSNGSGGMMLNGPDSTIMENGIEGATITKYTFNVPAVNGHSGNDYGRVRGYNVRTKQWDQLDYGTTSNGISFTRNLSSGIYSKLEFYYYTNHNCSATRS